MLFVNLNLNDITCDSGMGKNHQPTMYCLSMCEIFHFYCSQKLFSANKKYLLLSPSPGQDEWPCLPPDGA